MGIELIQWEVGSIGSSWCKDNTPLVSCRSR